MKTLSQRIAATPAGVVVDLYDEPMGAVRLLSIAKPVTVRGGVFASLQVSKCADLTFHGPVFRRAPGADPSPITAALTIADSERITVRKVDMIGGPALTGIPETTPAKTGLAAGNVIGRPSGRAIQIDRSRHVTIDYGWIQCFHKGVFLNASEDVLIRQVHARRLRTTGFSGGGGARITIDGCTHADSEPWAYGGAGDHGDFVHLWTTKGGKPIPGVRVTGCTFMEGPGGPMMGIYLDDDGHGLGFPDALVEGNTIVSAHHQGILLERVTGRVADNVLRWSGTGEAKQTPQIVLTAGCRDIELVGNVAKIAPYKLTPAEVASLRIAA